MHVYNGGSLHTLLVIATMFFFPCAVFPGIDCGRSLLFFHSPHLSTGDLCKMEIEHAMDTFTSRDMTE